MSAILAERAEAELVAETDGPRPRRRVRSHNDNGGDNGNGKRAHAAKRVPKRDPDTATTANCQLSTVNCQETREPGAIGWLRSGCSPSRAAERVAAESGVDESAAREMVASAVSELAGALWTGGREGRLAVAVEQRERVLAEAMASGDLKLALAAMESREKLMGLYGDAPSGGAETLLDLLRGVDGGARTVADVASPNRHPGV